MIGSGGGDGSRIYAAGKEDRVVVRMLVVMKTIIIAKAFAMVVGSAIIIIITQRLFSAIAAFLTSAASRKVDRPVVQVLVVMRTRITAKLL